MPAPLGHLYRESPAELGDQQLRRIGFEQSVAITDVRLFNVNKSRCEAQINRALRQAAPPNELDVGPVKLVFSGLEPDTLSQFCPIGTSRSEEAVQLHHPIFSTRSGRH